jgi:hypothetical protein
MHRSNGPPRRRGGGLLALALGLAGCAGAPPAPAPAPAPAPPAEAAAPLSPERQRFERWKQQDAAEDPREGFARAAETEAERRRREALARGIPSGGDAVEQEMADDVAIERRRMLDALATLGAWGASGCFPEEPDFSSQDDWIRHRTLSRGDFLEETEREVKPVVDVPGTETAAYVSIALSCVVEVRLEEPRPGHFEASLDGVRYFALLSRRSSWWSPRLRTQGEWILRHEQLHFDLAELVAQELDRNSPALRARVRAEGADPVAAVAALQARWAEHMDAAQRDFDAIEDRYDRETRHGTDFRRQTEWFGRVKRGLAAVRAGAETPSVLGGAD